MKNIAWDSYQLFLEVARHGGLTGAAETTGLSAATLGRRMIALERQAGRSFFSRSQTGYRLTADGNALYTALREMETVARRVETWREAPAQALVRLACGTWNARLFARNFQAIMGPADPFRLEILIAEQRAQLAHRENDIGIRAFEPQEQNLAAIPVGAVAYAAYCARTMPQPGPERWIAATAEDAISAYLRWPHEHRKDAIVVMVSRATALLDLAIAGVGTAVLPCFVGDAEPELQRAGGEIEALRHRQWIVVHDDDRHRREIRTVADRLRDLMRGHRDLFEGREARA